MVEERVMPVGLDWVANVSIGEFCENLRGLSWNVSSAFTHGSGYVCGNGLLGTTN
jgi:hypothetical protein